MPPLPAVHTDFMLVVGGAALPTKAGSVAYDPGLKLEMLRTSGKLRDDHAVASAYQPKITATLLDPDAFTTLGDVAGVMAVWGVYGTPGTLTVGSGQGFANATVFPKSLEWSEGGIAELQVEFWAKFETGGTLGTAPSIPATQAFINEAYRAKSVTIGGTTSESISKVSAKWEAELKGNPEFKPQTHYTEKFHLAADVTLNEALVVPLDAEIGDFSIVWEQIGGNGTFTSTYGRCSISKSVSGGKTSVKIVQLNPTP